MLKSSWMHPSLAARDSPTEGKGVFATKAVPAGTLLAVFGGDIMRVEEIDALPEHLQLYPMQIEERFVIGYRSALPPEDTDYFNHSCEPNAGINGQIFLVAMRDIMAGEEVTFDYAMVLSETPGCGYVFEMECLCGRRGCRKTITENDWKLPALQQRYDGFFSHYLQAKINTLRAAR